jgi:hypothetical protein
MRGNSKWLIDGFVCGHYRWIASVQIKTFGKDLLVMCHTSRGGDASGPQLLCRSAAVSVFLRNLYSPTRGICTD